MYIRRKVFSIAEDEWGNESLYSVNNVYLDDRFYAYDGKVTPEELQKIMDKYDPKVQAQKEIQENAARIAQEQKAIAGINPHAEEGLPKGFVQEGQYKYLDKEHKALQKQHQNLQEMYKNAGEYADKLKGRIKELEAQGLSAAEAAEKAQAELKAKLAGSEKALGEMTKKAETEATKRAKLEGEGVLGGIKRRVANTWGEGGWKKNWKGRAGLIAGGTAAAGLTGLAAYGGYKALKKDKK